MDYFSCGVLLWSCSPRSRRNICTNTVQEVTQEAGQCYFWQRYDRKWTSAHNFKPNPFPDLLHNTLTVQARELRWKNEGSIPQEQVTSTLTPWTGIAERSVSWNESSIFHIYLTAQLTRVWVISRLFPSFCLSISKYALVFEELISTYIKLTKQQGISICTWATKTYSILAEILHSNFVLNAWFWNSWETKKWFFTRKLCCKSSYGISSYQAQGKDDAKRGGNKEKGKCKTVVRSGLCSSYLKCTPCLRALNLNVSITTNCISIHWDELYMV